MSKHLNVGIIQMPIDTDPDVNISYISRAVERMMRNSTPPELVIGVEYGVSPAVSDTVPGRLTHALAQIAKQHQIYLIPGTMAEASAELGEHQFYNTCPIFGPNGDLIAAYRKKVPFRPGEVCAPSGDDDYCLFEIAEKQITVGVLICYDQFFPEIPRTLALNGAELIICPAADPIEFDHIPDILPRARALENEVFYIWTSVASSPESVFNGCGNSILVNPEGRVLYKCPPIPTTYCMTLDIGEVARKRDYGIDQHLHSLNHFGVKYPHAGRVGSAPVYRTLGAFTPDLAEYRAKLQSCGIGTIGSDIDPEIGTALRKGSAR